MSCLDNYIGLKVCGNETSDSGLFINSLPGISIEMLDKIAEGEQISFKGVWADIQAEAWDQFFIDFISETNKCFEITPYCDYSSLICDNKVKLASAWKYLLGAQTMLYRLYTPRTNYFTTVSRDDAKELLALYQVEYKERLEKAVKLIDVASCTDCMNCNNNPKSVTWLP